MSLLPFIQRAGCPWLHSIQRNCRIGEWGLLASTVVVCDLILVTSNGIVALQEGWEEPVPSYTVTKGVT